MKFLWLLFLAVMACRLFFGRWPWDFFNARQSRSQAVAHARKLLGVRADAGRDEIIEAHRKLVAMVHPDRGGTNEQVHEANAARDLLIDQLPEPIETKS